jgi:hypothetical protein
MPIAIKSLTAGYPDAIVKLFPVQKLAEGNDAK